MYVLDLKNSRINYATQTERKYFKIAVDYAQRNNTKSVKVNRIKFYFDFDKMQVMIGTNLNNAEIYKMAKI